MLKQKCMVEFTMFLNVLFCFEHGYEQPAKLSAMAKAAGFSAVGYNDLSGLPRVLVGTRS